MVVPTGQELHSTSGSRCDELTLNPHSLQNVSAVTFVDRFMFLITRRIILNDGNALRWRFCLPLAVKGQRRGAPNHWNRSVRFVQNGDFPIRSYLVSQNQGTTEPRPSA